MARAFLTRRTKFTAQHSYANENSHEHSYACDLTIAGEIDPVTGFILDLGQLDGILTDEITRRFDKRSINEDVPEFGDGLLAPSGENLARFIFDRVKGRLPENVDIVRVTVAEDETLSATYEGQG